MFPIKKSIIIIDDYISIRTLKMMNHVKLSIEIKLISDNKRGRDKLQERELSDFQINHSYTKLSR